MQNTEKARLLPVKVPVSRILEVVFTAAMYFFTTSFRMTLLTLFVGTANISFFHLWLKLVSSTNDFIHW